VSYERFSHGSVMGTDCVLKSVIVEMNATLC